MILRLDSSENREGFRGRGGQKSRDKVHKPVWNLSYLKELSFGG